MAFFLLLPAILFSQTEKVDLTMIYKIKAGRTKNSAIEELAYGLTDYAGPRLTGSTGGTRGMNGQRKRWKNLVFRM